MSDANRYVDEVGRWWVDAGGRNETKLFKKAIERTVGNVLRAPEVR